MIIVAAPAPLCKPPGKSLRNPYEFPIHQKNNRKTAKGVDIRPRVWYDFCNA